MKNFLIITNEKKDKELAVTKKLQSIIEKNGGISRVFSFEPNGDEEGLQKEIFLEGTDCVLVLGGDGTLLRVAGEACKKRIPVLGINLGTLGFLAEVEISNMDEAITKLMAGEYLTQERMMLDGSVLRKGISVGEGWALNDITINRCGSLQIICFSIYVNGKFLCTMNADGVILSTPTGSTGYNMSAGGPIAEPGAQLMILTPICAHTLNSRSIVLRSDDEVKIEIHQGHDGNELNVEASFDGKDKIAMSTGDVLRICKSDRTTTFVKLDERSFLEALHRKMSE